MKVRLLKRWPRRLLIEIGILLVVIAVMGVKVCVDLGQINDDVAKSTLTAEVQIQDASDQLSGVLTGSRDSSDALGTYSAYVQEVRDGLCTAFEDSFYARFSFEMNHCYQKRDELGKVIDVLARVSSLRDAQSGIIELIPAQNAATTASTRDAWTTAATQLKNLAVDAAIEPYRESVIDVVEAIAADWRAIAQADSDRNAQAFDDASQQLAVDVAKFAGITSLDEEISRQQAALNAALATFYD